MPKSWGELSVNIGVLKTDCTLSLDVTFAEDACRVRRGYAPQNLALLRRIALNALNSEHSFRRSTRQKSNRAAMDNDYMFKVLSACLPVANDNSELACQ